MKQSKGWLILMLIALFSLPLTACGGEKAAISYGQISAELE